ncbi:MAG: hypothetical protein MUO82_03910 [Candidatus Thermoplasmatota archaeon]|nr:hypothetical protein [Candidatus Thermoplasmatota archaeon]
MNENQMLENDLQLNPYAKENKTSPKIIIAGVLLIIAGVLSIIMLIFLNATLSSNPGQFINISQFTEIDPNITLDDVIGLMNICLSIAMVISIFPILGGILCFRKKLWGICLTCAIIGIFTIWPLIIPGILSVIAVVLLYLSRKEFH